MPPVGEGRQRRVARQGLLVLGQGGGVPPQRLLYHGEKRLFVDNMYRWFDLVGVGSGGKGALVGWGCGVDGWVGG